MKNERAAHLVFFCKKSFLFLNNFFLPDRGKRLLQTRKAKAKEPGVRDGENPRAADASDFSKGLKKGGSVRAISQWMGGRS